MEGAVPVARIDTETEASKEICAYVKAALPSSMSLPLAPGSDLPQNLTAMHMSRPHLLRK